ncbi:MAG: hypothetical protein ACREGC_00200, partial [Minisyncoccia bacterium]
LSARDLVRQSVYTSKSKDQMMHDLIEAGFDLSTAKIYYVWIGSLFAGEVKVMGPHNRVIVA